MQKRIPYALYKNHYSEFSASEYDAGKKTILVSLPDVAPVSFPKTWERSGNNYHTPGGCVVSFWGSGLAQSFSVHRVNNWQNSVDICPGLYAKQKVLDAVAALENK